MIDSEFECWKPFNWPSDNVISIQVPPFRHHVGNVTFRELFKAMIESPHYGGDRVLMMLQELVKEIASDHQTSSLIVKSIVDEILWRVHLMHADNSCMRKST